MHFKVCTSDLISFDNETKYFFFNFYFCFLSVLVLYMCAGCTGDNHDFISFHSFNRKMLHSMDRFSQRKIANDFIF